MFPSSSLPESSKKVDRKTRRVEDDEERGEEFELEERSSVFFLAFFFFALRPGLVHFYRPSRSTSSTRFDSHRCQAKEERTASDALINFHFRKPLPNVHPPLPLPLLPSPSPLSSRSTMSRDRLAGMRVSSPLSLLFARAGPELTVLCSFLSRSILLPPPPSSLFPLLDFALLLLDHLSLLMVLPLILTISSTLLVNLKGKLNLLFPFPLIPNPRASSFPSPSLRQRTSSFSRPLIYTDYTMVLSASSSTDSTTTLLSNNSSSSSNRLDELPTRTPNKTRPTRCSSRQLLREEISGRRYVEQLVFSLRMAWMGGQEEMETGGRRRRKEKRGGEEWARSILSASSFFFFLQKEKRDSQ